MKANDINTAPKNGVRILVFNGDWHIARWSEDRWDTGWLILTYPDGDVNSRLMVDEPSHWLKLTENPLR